MRIFRRTIAFACLLLSLFGLGLRNSRASERGNYISHGPILGRVSAHGIGVWARTGHSGPFQVKYGLSPDKMDQLSKPVVTTLKHDNTAWMHLTKLKANTKYYYELVLPDVAGSTGRSGSFKTMPDSRDFFHPETNPRGLYNFSFEFACGNNQNPEASNGPALPTFATMLRQIKDKIDFAILNGDWLYESQRAYTPRQWLAQVHQPDGKLPRHLEVTPTMVGVWQNYKHFLTQGANLARWHREVPSFFTYDDHEILNDIWGAGTPGLRDRRAVYRDVGVRAWYDYLGWSNPTKFTQPNHFGKARLQKGSDILVDPDTDFTKIDLKQVSNLHVHWGTKTDGVNDNELDGVASYSIGRRSYFHMRIANCDFFVLDTRGQRQMHDTKDPYKKGLSMLGPVQRDWLIEGMKNSDADFIFLVSSVNLTVPHVGGGKVRSTNKDDAWTVFFDEREKLINFWDSLNKPVLVLTGDLHNSFAIKITDNVWEFASGPHNSQNHHAGDEGDRLANGPFKYGPREVEIRWSTYFRSDVPRPMLKRPTFCVVTINNVFNNPKQPGKDRWVAYPKPHVLFQYYDGRTGDLQYAEPIHAKALR